MKKFLKFLFYSSLQTFFPKTFTFRLKDGIALTFDDGPNSKYTPQILDILKSFNIKVTFFVVGERCLKHPDVFKSITDQGHRLGNHTFTHPDLTKLNIQDVNSEIQKTSKIVKSHLLRPPYSRISFSLFLYALRNRYKIVLSSFESLDWKLDKETILKNFHPKNGDIVLLHNKNVTVQILPEIIKKLKEKYKFSLIN